MPGTIIEQLKHFWSIESTLSGWWIVRMDMKKVFTADSLEGAEAYILECEGFDPVYDVIMMGDAKSTDHEFFPTEVLV